MKTWLPDSTQSVMYTHNADRLDRFHAQEQAQMALGATSVVALLVPIALLLLGGRRAEAAAWGGAASGCLPVSVSIKAPARVAPAKDFRIKVTIANQGSGSIQNALVGVRLPVDLTVLKTPAGVVDAGNSSGANGGAGSGRIEIVIQPRSRNTEAPSEEPATP